MPTEWKESTCIILSLYKGKGVALKRGNYLGPKFLDQVMKVLERVAENFLWQQVCIDDVQFGFMPGCSTTDAIFIVRRFQKKFMPSIRHCTWPLLIWKRHSIVYPDVASGGLFASSVLMSGWCSSYRAWMKTPSRVHVRSNLSEESSVKVGVHQGSCLSPLLFITVLEALSQEFRTGCPWENVYAEMAIVTELLAEVQQKLILWKTSMEGEGLRVNMGKTKVLVCVPGLGVL